MTVITLIRFTLSVACLAPLFVLSSTLMLGALQWLGSRKFKKPSDSDGAFAKALEETQAAMIPAKLSLKKRVRIAAIFVV